MRNYTLHRWLTGSVRLNLQDLDAAFTRGVTRDASSTGAPTAKDAATTAADSKDTANDGSTLSLSGLLNSLDGVAAAEGRYDTCHHPRQSLANLSYGA